MAFYEHGPDPIFGCSLKVAEDLGPNPGGMHDDSCEQLRGLKESPLDPLDRVSFHKLDDLKAYLCQRCTFQQIDRATLFQYSRSKGRP